MEEKGGRDGVEQRAEAAGANERKTEDWLKGEGKDMDRGRRKSVNLLLLHDVLSVGCSFF